MRIILYQKVVRLNGTFTFDKIFTRTFGKKHEILYVYEAGEKHLIDEIGKNAVVTRNEGQSILGDICIYSSVSHGVHRIKAKKFIQIVHTDLHDWKVDYKPVGIDLHVAVGESVANSLKKNNGLDSVVIPNFLEEPKVDKVLRLITASRIAERKGFERIAEMAKRLSLAGKKFVWEIYGNGTPSFVSNFRYSISNNPSVVLMGERSEVQSFMVDCDYLVQLSDSEGFCYSIHEALQVGTPVIVTDWVGVRNVVLDGINGYILNFDLSNLDINKIYSTRPVCGKLKVENNLLAWDNILII